VKIGVRAHDYGKRPAAELASGIAEAGFSCIQLAPAKALPGEHWKPGTWDAAEVAETRSVFDNSGLRVSVLGCYINPVHPDPDARLSELSRFTECIRFCRDFGCALVATETGSHNADCSPHPLDRSEESYLELVESIGTLVGAAEDAGVYVGVEGVSRHVAHSPARIRRLIDDIRSPVLKVVFDPVNFVEEGSAEEMARIVGESFDLFGDRIAAIHVKDFLPSPASEGGSRTGPAGEFRVVPPGRGYMSGHMFWRKIAEKTGALAAQPDLIIEDLKPSEMAAAREFVLACWGSV